MLSTTSLLHGNCVFNRNNTVATQQGMKTYWLCKSYRISMCRARCITHQGRVISATGVHNHPPHMRKASAPGSGGTNFNDATQILPTHPANTLPCNMPGNMTSTAMQPVCSNINSSSGGGAGCYPSLRPPHQTLPMFQQNQTSQHLLPMSPTLSYSSHYHSHPNLMAQPHSSMPASPIINHHGSHSSLASMSQSQSSVIQNSMLNANLLQHAATGGSHASSSYPALARNNTLQADNANGNLVITMVTSESPKHTVHSPSKMTKPSRHELPTLSTSNCGNLKVSPHDVQSCHDRNSSSDLSRVLEAEVAPSGSPSDMRIIPKMSDVHSEADVVGNSEASCIGTPERTQGSRPMQISSEAENNFKIENM